ncbi:MAG: 50S ribosomal protein L24 [Flavobacteriaceae bacterium]|nr:50S ribosomal protein L24 [Flavobacteriaceae bacterium]|tara:strand:- start:220 stop:531 length:312 start_codon:yes stop_codon:yes gene_type:complete
MIKIKFKNGDKVRVIAGDHKGTEGEIVELIREKNKAIVLGVNVVKRHTKPNAQNPQGGIIEKEAPIAISNLSLLTAEGETTRIGYRMEDGKKVRVSRKTNEAI